jgi:hypothetical protein
MKFLGTVLATALVGVLLDAPPAQGFCGLQSCPRVEPRGASHSFEAGLRTRAVAFDIAGERGVYGVASPRFFARALGMTLGAEVPLVTLHTGDVDASGLGNPVLMAQYARRFSHDWSGELGVQWELPLGDTEHGLADDHMMVLPWIGLRKEWSASWHTSGMLGYSTTLEGDYPTSAAAVSSRGTELSKSSHNGVDHGIPGQPPVYVNPHGDREVHWRAGLGARAAEAWTFEAFGLGQADLSEANTVFYARAGLSAEWALTSSLTLQAIADAPVTSARRSETALGLDIKATW